MKAITGSLLAALVLASVTPVNAAVITSFKSSDRDRVIDVGDDITYTLGVRLLPLGKYDDAEFVGGRVSIFSGEGERDNFRIKGDGDKQTFKSTFTYDEVGDFTARFFVRAKYEQTYTEDGVIGKRYFTLEGWSTILLCEPIIGKKFFDDDFVETKRGSLSVSVVPGPHGGSALASVLALGWGFWHRRRKRLAAVA